jgi:hypothetical protein
MILGRDFVALRGILGALVRLPPVIDGVAWMVEPEIAVMRLEEHSVLLGRRWRLIRHQVLTQMWVDGFFSLLYRRKPEFVNLAADFIPGEVLPVRKFSMKQRNCDPETIRQSEIRRSSHGLGVLHS